MVEKKRSNLSKKVSVSILSIIILSAVIFYAGYTYGISYGSGLPSSIIESGSMVSGYSYTIFTDGVTYWAKNGTTGAIDYSGTSASTVINSALGALTAGRTWKEKVLLKGTFTILNKLQIPSFTILDLRVARLIAGSGITDGIIWLGSSNDVEIIGGYIDADIQSIPNIIMWNSKRVKIVDVTTNKGTYGVYAAGTTGVASAENIWLENIKSYNASVNNIGIGLIDIAKVGYTKNVWIVNCNLEEAQSDNISVNGVENAYIISNKVSNSAITVGDSAIGTDLSKNVQIINNIIDTVKNSGIAIASPIGNINVIGNIEKNSGAFGILVFREGHAGEPTTLNVTIIGNQFIDNVISAGVYLGSAGRAISNIKVIGNTMRGNKYAIYLDTNLSNIETSNNDVLGNNYTISGTAPTNWLRHQNLGYVTENSGSLSSVTGAQIVAHGLVDIPNDISIVPDVTGITVSNVYADATNIYFTLSAICSPKWSAKVV